MAPRIRIESSEMGPITQIPLEYFVEHVLPPLHPDINVDAVFQKLKRAGKGTRRPITKSGRWWGFGQDPMNTRYSVSRSYVHFPKIIDAIVQYGAPHGFVPCLDFMHNPRPFPTHKTRDDSVFPDAFMLPSGTSKTDVKWADIGVVGEYDKNEPSDSPNSNIKWSVARALEDPRRRFIFGYTVENTSMKLWFFHRTEAIFSTGFNFITDPRTLIHVFLSLLFAEPHELGWDTTMNPIPDPGDNMQYDFTVESSDGSKSLFRSLELIYGGESATRRRRGTRIWKVIRVIDGIPSGEPLVLKDSWIHEESEREGTTLRRIQDCNNTDDFQHNFSTHFLTVVRDGDVILHSSRRPPSRDHSLHHVQVCRRNRQLGNGTSDSSPLSGRKVHYRVVFKERCRPLHLDIPLSDVFRALGQTCAALKILHEAGWVHRDVSMNNVMLDEAGRARLADLEYAKKMGDDSVPEFRVGTVPFMSSEVHSQTYWCGTLEAAPIPRIPRSPQQQTPHNSNNSSSSLSGIHKFAAAAAKRYGPLWRSPSPGNDSAPPPCPPAATGRFPVFRYNPLHDLESVFWIATFFLFNHSPEDTSHAVTKQRKEAANRVLYNQHHHCAIIRLDGTFEEELASLSKPLEALGRMLEMLRSELTAAYYAAEKDITCITSSVASDLHDRFMKILQSMSDLAE
ncbi:hypothetical protein NM688_g7587 [Phlebia brevispora]|uniref:Uncharacterized protein n=1 Tax=Phlebia brevispora TaxID=194682 RepID=A0ACC1S446_9APHY|nr:hypothetical protein NM688_g7587 [Phlebia brevispora]